MIPHLQLEINGLAYIFVPGYEKQKAARGRPHLLEIPICYRTIELVELVTVISLPALPTWAVWV